VVYGSTEYNLFEVVRLARVPKIPALSNIIMPNKLQRTQSQRLIFNYHWQIDIPYSYNSLFAMHKSIETITVLLLLHLFDNLLFDMFSIAVGRKHDLPLIENLFI